jgi:hypothetical protein
LSEHAEILDNEVISDLVQITFKNFKEPEDYESSVIVENWNRISRREKIFRLSIMKEREILFDVELADGAVGYLQVDLLCQLLQKKGAEGAKMFIEKIVPKNQIMNIDESDPEQLFSLKRHPFSHTFSTDLDCFTPNSVHALIAANARKQPGLLPLLLQKIKEEGPLAKYTSLVYGLIREKIDVSSWITKAKEEIDCKWVWRCVERMARRELIDKWDFKRTERESCIIDLWNALCTKEGVTNLEAFLSDDNIEGREMLYRCLEFVARKDKQSVLNVLGKDAFKEV